MIDRNNIKSVGEIVRKNENDYIQGTTTISKYVEFSQYENIEKIDAYLNSKHISGEVDSLGRDKPFFNIVTGAVNVWYRATDIDRKDIRIRATKQKQTVAAFLATSHLQSWMRREKFGTFLNDWGRSLARYGSSVLKFVEKDGKLHAIVMPWNRMIVDTVDFDNNVKIEILELTEAQLRQNKAYDQEMVEALCYARTARTTMGRQKKDNKNDYVKLYEVHGMLPLANLKLAKGEEPDEEDFDNYVQQMHVVSFVAAQKKGDYEDFTLVSGRENKDPYMITHLIKEDGRTQSIGAVEHLFQAQWMSNHTVKQMKDQLDLASKLIFQTADPNFVGQNVLTAIETGDIMIHATNQPLTQVQNNSHDITSIQNFNVMWGNLGKDVTSTPEAITGGTMPSGTAYRQVAILNQESHSLFELMTENKGLHIEDMLREYVIPFLKKGLKHSKELVAELDDYGIKQIQDMWVKNEAIERHTRHIIDSITQGKQPQPFNAAASQAQIEGELSQQGTTRYIKPSDVSQTTWDSMFKDLEWEVEVQVTNESSDKEAILTTLANLFQTIAGLQGRPMTDQEKFIFNKILEISGDISPLEMPPDTSQGAPAAPIAQPAPAQQPAPANPFAGLTPPQGQ